MMLAHLTPLGGALSAIAIGIVVGILISALLSYPMHRADHYRIARLRGSVREAAERLLAADRDGLDMDHASHHVVHRLREALEHDRVLAQDGEGRKWH